MSHTHPLRGPMDHEHGLAAFELELAERGLTDSQIGAQVAAWRGELDEAMRRVNRTPESPASLSLLVALLHARGQADAAQRVAARALQRFPAMRPWLAACELVDAAQLAELPPHDETLAQRLVDRPGLVAALVDALRIQPHPTQVRLLRATLQRLAETQPHEAALAQLALMEGDPEDAAAWAKRGLEQNPYDARLALLLAQTRDEHALPALRRAHEAHPGYPDVRAALREYEQRGAAA